MRNKTFLISSIIIGALLSVSCTNDSTDDLIGDPDLENLSYTDDIKSIIDNNCISCHAATPINGAPMSLTTYENVKNAIQTKGLIDRISRDQDAVGMMPNGGTRLPQETIDKISAWASQGFKE